MNINKIDEYLEDVEKNFSQLIDAIIYYDSIDDDNTAWDIIYEIEALNPELQIKLLIKDLKERNYEVQKKLLYNCLWYAQANTPKHKEILIELIKNTEEKEKILEYLKPLNKGKNRVQDINIQSVIDAVNSQGKLPKP